MHGSKQAWMNHICQLYGIKVDVLWLSRSHFIACTSGQPGNTLQAEIA